MKAIFLMFLLVFILVINDMSAADGEKALLPVVEVTLCQSHEAVVASCMIEGNQREIVSICSDPKTNMISYHFGTKENAELNVEFTSVRKIFRWINKFSYATFFGFNWGEYAYILQVPQETFGAKAILYTKKAKEPFSYSSPSRECTNNSFGDKNLVSEALEDLDDQSIEYEGLLFPPDDRQE